MLTQTHLPLVTLTVVMAALLQSATDFLLKIMTQFKNKSSKNKSLRVTLKTFLMILLSEVILPKQIKMRYTSTMWRFLNSLNCQESFAIAFLAHSNAQKKNLLQRNLLFLVSLMFLCQPWRTKCTWPIKCKDIFNCTLGMTLIIKIL